MTRLAALWLAVVAGCGGDPSPTEVDAIAIHDGISPDAAPADPCPATPPSCSAVTVARGSGLHAIDRCAFPLTDRATWTDRGAVVDAFSSTAAPRTTLAEIATDLNRTATTVPASAVPGNPPGVERAFEWQAGDESVTYWIPQGITGSFDGRDDGKVDNRQLVLVSWYYEQANEPGSTVDKGVRIAIVDTTNPAAIAYRFALLVEPVMRDGRPDFSPVRVHAGGLAWYGDLLYVPVTGSGFRVFDLSRILRVAGTADRLGYDAATGNYDAHGYKYVIPQIGEYVDAGTCDAVFSYVALDRSGAAPALVSGEYDSATVNGRFYRWPLDPATGRLQLTAADRVIPEGAWVTAESHVQGGLAHGSTVYLSSSQPANAAGALYRTAVDTPSTTLGWIDTPEDLAFDPQNGRVWSLSEGTNARYVIAVALDAID